MSFESSCLICRRWNALRSGRFSDWPNNRTITLPVWYHLRDGYPVGVEDETGWSQRGPVGQAVKGVIFLYGILQGLPHCLRFVLRLMDNRLLEVVELGGIGSPRQLRPEVILSFWHQLGQRLTRQPEVRQGDEIMPPELLAGIGLESGVISYGGSEPVSQPESSCNAEITGSISGTDHTPHLICPGKRRLPVYGAHLRFLHPLYCERAFHLFQE